MGEARRRVTLLLASASPRRRQLIGLLGLPLETAASQVDESPRVGETPEKLTTRLARAKAEALARGARDRVVIGADSEVVLNRRPLGKPGNPEQAVRMLEHLRAREHQVLSGVAVVDTDRDTWHTGLVRTRVRMRAYSDAEMAAYVDSGAPLDKAGAYGIQDLAFRPVERILGCYLNVVGLPLCEVAQGLAALGCAPPALAREPFIPPCRLCVEGQRLVQAE